MATLAPTTAIYHRVPLCIHRLNCLAHANNNHNGWRENSARLIDIAFRSLDALSIPVWSGLHDNDRLPVGR